MSYSLFKIRKTTVNKCTLGFNKSQASITELIEALGIICTWKIGKLNKKKKSVFKE